MTPLRRLARFPEFFVRRRIFGQAVPLLADFKLTHRCNLACAACPLYSFDTPAGVFYTPARKDFRQIGTMPDSAAT